MPVWVSTIGRTALAALPAIAPTSIYVPVGITARTRVASRRALSVNLEFDRLLHGWQKTRGSALGGGTKSA